jgi:integrase
MAVYKRGNLWWYKFQFQGRSIRKPTKFTNRTAALRAEAKHKADLLDRRAGLSQKKIAPKFEEYVKVFLAWSKQHHRPKTTALHTTNCDTLKRFFKGHWLDEIDQAAVENYKSDRMKEDRRNADDGSKVTGATVNRSLTTLKLMFGRAEKCGFGVSNPVRGVAYLPESAGRIRVVSFQEELTYLSKASQPLRDIAQTILDTGLRPEEVFRIRVENIDFAARTIFNPFGKTKAARRTVTMTEAVWTALKRRAKTAKGSYVFPSKKHTDRPIASVRKAHNAAIRRAAIKQHFVLYDLRHTFATRAVAAGVDLPTLSAMLGHTSITMTMRYVHPAAEQKRLAAAKLETFRVNGLIVAASEQAAELERLAAIEQAAEQERLAAAKLETFRINGLMDAASEQAVGTKMGTEARIN